MDLTSPERWKAIERIFAQVLDLVPAERPEFLARLERSDPTLGVELKRLLTAHDSAGAFLDSFDVARGAALLASASGDNEEDTPATIGRYRLVRRLGGGGMGVVHLAYDPRLDRPVAIKLLHRRHAAGDDGRQLLLEEARAASALDHPNIAAIHEVGETPDGRVFVAMVFCEGESLAERIARGRLAPGEVVGLGRQIANALAAAHGRGITHRDLKPGNIMVSPDGRARLVDFGIAKIAGRESDRRGSEPGTLGYMSPEQLSTRGGEVGPRSDLWSLGVVLYEALTGRRPFGGDSAAAMVDAIRLATLEPVRVVRPDVPSPLANLVERCLAKDPADRPTGAHAVAAELDALLAAGEPFAVRAGTRRSRWLAGAVAVLGVVAAAVLARALFRSMAGSAAAGTTVAILPFAPASTDSGLARLGRELVVTLSSSLDGVGGIRIVEPTAVLSRTESGSAVSLEDAATLARRLGADQLLTGQLTASGARIRLDMTVHSVADLNVLARASAVAAANDVGGLTDTAAVALLHGAWAATDAAPNPTALSSRSLPALRAYLDGELAIAGGRFRAAPQAFARAIEADSTFWFAYWRYMYALSYHGERVDSAIVTAVYAHRSTFPEPDRRLVEARVANGRQERIERLRAITTRFPDYWPAWFEVGDVLTHNGAFLGRPVEDAIAALQRAADLNPTFVPAWEHLLWLGVFARDTALSGQALAMLRGIPIDSMNSEHPDLATLTYYRYLDALARNGGEPLEMESAVGARVLSGYAGSVPPEGLAVSLANYGFHRAQLEISRRVRLREPRPDILAAHDWSTALSWAGRGVWDSTFVAARRYAGATAHPRGALWAFGLTSVGAWLGALTPDSLAALREHALDSERGRSPEGQAEVAWLDGIVACARRDTAALRAQRLLLERNGTTGAAALNRSLAAMENALAGRTAAAGRALAQLEWENADRGWHFAHGAIHPFFTAVNRLAAGRWLLAAGDTAEVMRLLLLHQTSLPQPLHPLPAVNMLLAGYTFRELALLEEARGRPERGRRYRDRAAGTMNASFVDAAMATCEPPVRSDPQRPPTP